MNNCAPYNQREGLQNDKLNMNSKFKKKGVLSSIFFNSVRDPRHCGYGLVNNKT